jgi:hypothetical protein
MQFTEHDQGGSPRRHRPCRARPADRSLVAEDRSAEGVRDRPGPKPPLERGEREYLSPFLSGRQADST